MAKKSNIIKMFRRPSFNIGFLIFAIIFIYLLVSVIIFATTKKSSIYTVTDGSLAVENVYNGLILRDETVCTSSYAGSVNYFLKNKHRAGKDTMICSVDESGRVFELINQYNVELYNENDLTELRKKFIKMSSEYDNNRFYETYTQIEASKGTLYEMQAASIAENLDSYVEQTNNDAFFHKIYPEITGLVVYNIDGYESIGQNDITADLFDTGKYQPKNLQTNTLINKGDSLYKVINNEIWNIYVKFDSAEVDAYSGRDSVNICFPEKNIETIAKIEVVDVNGESYGKLTLDKYLLSFADLRFVNIEITQDSPYGLKIPNSAICTRNSYSIPKEYMTDSKTFIVQKYNANGEIELESVNPHIYYADEDNYYVSINDFESGTLLLKANSTETFVVGIIKELEGVYCVNKGYTEFKAISILDKNNSYSIVKSKTEYGLAKYDFIILNQNTVKDYELLN